MIEGLKFDISVDEYSQGIIEIYYKDKVTYNSFELPYDIAEYLAFTLSNIGEVNLEDENGVQSIFKNGEMI